ncbi:hypothetical protein PFISCL1PPCAC_23769, partial [Pristionchus fissidentatus]
LTLYSSLLHEWSPRVFATSEDESFDKSAMRQKHVRIAFLILIFIQQCTGETETKIDWTRCTEPGGHEKADTVCYVKVSCKHPLDQKSKMETLKDVNHLAQTNNPRDCGTGIQLKPLGKRTWLVYIQVAHDALKADKGARIQVENNHFGCEKDGFKSDIRPLTQDTYAHAESTFSDKRIFCAFIISTNGDNLKSVLSTSGTSSLSLVYETSSQDAPLISLTIETVGTISSRIDDIFTCNSENAVLDSKYADESLFIEPAIIIPGNNKCPSSKGNLYLKGPNEQSYNLVEKLTCELDPSDTKYKFKYTKKGDSPIIIPPESKFQVFCGWKVCATCSDITTSCTQDECKPTHTPGVADSGTCAKIECSTGRWLIQSEDKSESGIKVTDLECKKIGANAAWVLKGGKSAITTAQCTAEHDCQADNPLKFECPPSVGQENCIIAQLNKRSNGWGCGSSPIMAAQGNSKAISVGNFTCDSKDGTWKYNTNKVVPNGSSIYCDTTAHSEPSTGSMSLLFIVGGVLVVVLILVVAAVVFICIRRHRKYTASEKELRRRPGVHWMVQMFSNSGLPTSDLAALKEWDGVMFETILNKWMKFAIYERYKFAERISFELGVSSTCEQFISLLMRVFEVETDYRVWNNLIPTFKLLHAQAADKEDNKDCDQRLRKLAVVQSKKLLEKFGWEGVNSEFRDTAYQRYLVFNLLYYCDDKDSIEKMIAMFEKQKFNLHSINRQVCWAAAVRDRGQFDWTMKAAQQATVDKNIAKEFGEPKKKKGTNSNTKTDASTSEKKGKKDGGSKESKSKDSKSNNSNRSNKSKKDKKGSKEQPSSQGNKGGSKESRSSTSGKDKKGGSKESAGRSKGKSREKAGSEENTGPESNMDKKEPSDKDKRSGKDRKDASGKDKKTVSGKEKKTVSGKEKKTTSGKEKKTVSGKECQWKSTSGRSSKEKKDKSGKGGSKESKSEKGAKTEKTAADKSAKTKKSIKSNRSTRKVGLKERKDADGDKLHGDRAQHLFFALGSSRNKEQVANFINYFVKEKEYDPSNLVYLFLATLEWDDTRANGLDLFLSMDKVAFKKMPPGQKYHMRILRNFRRYVIGQIDLQKIEDHITHDPNYTTEHYKKLELALMLKRIHNTVQLQPRLIDDLDKALKKFDL